MPGAPRLAVAAVLLLALVPLLVSPVLPFIDFYNHVARFEVLAHPAADAVRLANYAPDWDVLPNMGLDLIGVALLKLLPPGLLPHLLTLLIMAVILVGVRALNRALAGGPSPLATLLAVPLLYSWILNWGFANFLLGLGLALAAAAWWVERRGQAWRLPVAMLLAVVIFLCHGLAFGLYGLLIASLELGHWWQQPGRDGRALARAWGLCLAQAVVPVLLFLQSPTIQAEQGVSNAYSSVRRLVDNGQLLERLERLVIHRAETIVRVAEGPSLLPDILWTAAMVAILGWMLVRRRIRLVRTAWPALAVGLALLLFTPPALFGSGYIDDRIPLFLALVAVAAVRPTRPAPAMTLVLAGLVAVRLIAIALAWHDTANDLADFDRVASLVPPRQVMDGYAPTAMPHADVARRCEMYQPLLLLRHGQVVPLFAARTAQPLLLTGRLAHAQAVVATAPTWPSAAYIAALGRAGYDYVLLCRTRRNEVLPATPYPVVAESGRFRLLRLRPAPLAAPPN